MGLFSEINASYNARNYEKILRAAWDEGSTEVWNFACNSIIPIYLEEIGETFGGHKIPDDIKKHFHISIKE